MARICGVSQAAVWKWLQSSKRLPAEHVLVVEAKTGVSRHHLRPDIYPIDLPPAGRFYGVDHAAAGRDFTSLAVRKDGHLIEVRTA
jgi:DNA-binding transcriptional regulator YdaS (Cro superfamily)